MAGRQSSRLLSRQLRAATSQPCTARSFSSIPARLGPHNFTMPAMSPTMTEGNIASWKVKEGDSFSTGDVLLEIETDKATIDVEAQDDGVMAKIFEQDGAKGVQVGSRIAVIGDAGDDPSSLEIPAEDKKPSSQSAEAETKTKESAPSEPSPKESAPEPAKQPQKKAFSSSPKPSGPGQNPKYPLYPSVIALLHANHIPDSDISKIPATGPQNRLLKGDVLAYLDRIPSAYPSESSARITHLAHLDLSNIKLLPQTQKPKSTDAAAAAAPAAPAVTTISLPISLSPLLSTQRRLSDTLGINIPLTTLLARAVDLANDDLPLPKNQKASQTDLFNAVLGIDRLPTTSRGSYLPQIDALPPASTSFVASSKSRTVGRRPDIIDLLTTTKSSSRTPARRTVSTASQPALISPVGGSISTTGGAVNVFTLTVPVGEERRARTFLERVKTSVSVEPGRLVL